MIYQVTILALALASVQSAVVYKAANTVFTDCGKGVDGVRMAFNQGYMKPDPVMWPGNATVGGQLVVMEDLPSKNLRLKSTIKRSSPLGVITVPCIESLAFGSCDFDVCEYLLPKYKDTFCDNAGICECPVKKGTYNAKDFVQPLPNDPLAGLVIAGEYDGTAKFVDAEDEGKVFGCINVKFSIVKEEDMKTTTPKTL